MADFIYTIAREAQNRRKFLSKLLVGAGSLALAGCGSDEVGIAPPPVIIAPPPPPPPAPPPPTITSVAKFSVSARKSGVAGFAAGFVFRQGAIPKGQFAAASQADIQVVIKSTWPDGSAKIASVAGTLSFAAGQSVPIELGATTTAPSAMPLSTSGLRNTNIQVGFASGAFGSANFAADDWDRPFLTWLSGPRMSSWIYRKPFGTDQHLTAWMEVRLYASGSVEILPWIENGYLKVTNPSNRSAIFDFSINNVRRFSETIDLKHHQRTPLIKGAMLSHWLNDDPEVSVRHDAAYLMDTELVPTYIATVPNDGPRVLAQVSTFEPLQKGGFTYDGDSMAGTGYQEPIGLLPEHDALYLAAKSAELWSVVQRNGYSAGRYAIHYRDEETGRPLLFSSFPTLNIPSNQGFKDTGGSTNGQYTPSITGGNPPQWDCAHSPSVGYLAYLVTCRFYFMEEVLFAATVNYLGNGDASYLRNGSQGLVQPDTDAWQTRSCAWDWRTRAQALCVIPDDDIELKREFINSVQANIDHFYSRYVAQANNPFGFIQNGTSAYDKTTRTLGPWQQDFVTACFGYSACLGLPISAAHQTRLMEFFNWTAKSVVVRLGDQNSGWWYINAANYTAKVGPVSQPKQGILDWKTGTGPWYSQISEVYTETYTPQPSWLGKTEGVLAGEIMPGERSFWGNLQPAIAYAVRHNVPGASDGYRRMTSAQNWGNLRAAFDINPVWGIGPLGSANPPGISAAPVWLKDKPLNAWFEIPGTAGAGGAYVDAWAALVLQPGTGLVFSPANGGHNNSADNRVTSIDLIQDQPSWTIRKVATPAGQIVRNVSHYNDGAPSSRHGYHHAHYISQGVDRIMMFGGRYVYGDGVETFAVDGFDPATNAWDRQGTWAPLEASKGYGTAHNPTTGEVWTLAGWRWSPANSWQKLTSFPVIWRWPVAYQSTSNEFFTLQFGDGQGFDEARGVVATRFNAATGAQRLVTFNAGPGLTSFIQERPSYASMVYDPLGDRFLFYSGLGQAAGRLYSIKPQVGDVWDISIVAQDASSRTPKSSDLGGGTNGKMLFVPALNGIVLMSQGDQNLSFMRLG